MVFGSILVSLALGSVLLFLKKKAEKHLVFSFHIFITFFILLFLTPNHQGRHFFHLYPSFIFTFLLLILSIPEKGKYIALVGVVFLSAYSVYPIVFTPTEQLAKTELCFMGYSPEDYDIPRWVDDKLKNEIKPNTIFLNYLDPTHVNKSDAEVLLSLSAYKNKARFVINPKKIEKLSPDYKTLITAANSCNILEQSPLTEVLKTKPWKLTKDESSEKACVKSYELLN